MKTYYCVVDIPTGDIVLETCVSDPGSSDHFLHNRERHARVYSVAKALVPGTVYAWSSSADLARQFAMDSRDYQLSLGWTPLVT